MDIDLLEEFLGDSSGTMKVHYCAPYWRVALVNGHGVCVLEGISVTYDGAVSACLKKLSKRACYMAGLVNKQEY